MSTSVRCVSPVGTRRRNNPYVGKRKTLIYHILNKISIYKNSKHKENGMFNSLINSLKIDLFTISEEVENEYSTYKLKKKNGYRKHARKFSFYNNDGSFNCIGILLGMCSDEDYIREKSVKIFFVNMEKIVASDDFRDLVTLVFSCSVCLYLYFTIFFNFTEYMKHILMNMI